MYAWKILSKEKYARLFRKPCVLIIYVVYDSQQSRLIFMPKKSRAKKNTNPSCEKFVLFLSGAPPRVSEEKTFDKCFFKRCPTK